jgi:hypothetical protein
MMYDQNNGPTEPLFLGVAPRTDRGFQQKEVIEQEYANFFLSEAS